MALQVTGIDHIYVTVSNLHRSEEFYDKVMKLLDFRKGNNTVGGEPCVHYYNPYFQYTLRQAQPGANAHNPLAPGLNHLCFQVPDNNAVDTAARELQSFGVLVSTPQLYPEYAADYYAIYFTDPDGIRLEIVNQTRIRNVIRERWNELDTFENPLKKIRAI